MGGSGAPRPGRAGPCTFCQIVADETDAERVLADETAVAFLDHRPLFPGHVLVVPRGHVPTLAELPAAALGPFFARVQLLERAVQRAVESQGTFVAVNNRVSQSVPHLHVHVVPRNRGDGLRGFFWPRQPYADAGHRGRVAAAIRSALEALREGPA